MASKNTARLLAVALLFPLLLSSCGPKDKFKVRYSGPYPDAHYLNEIQLAALVADFPPPPAPGSPKEKEDVAQLLVWQKNRTPLQCAAALVQDKALFPEVFGGDANPFSKPEAPAVLDFFQKAGEDSKLAAARLKNHCKRPRPHEPGLTPCLEEVGSKYSYPSIHAVHARVLALLLSDFAPQRRKEFLAAADAASDNRLYAGVHYPSDVDAGKAYGNLVYAELMKNPGFRAEMDSLRQYLQK